MLFEMSKRALDIFATKKSSVFSSTRWTFKASREARRRTAVTPKPTCFPTSTLCAIGAQTGVQGLSPCC